MVIFYKGRCQYCKKDINGNNYIWIPYEKTLVHRECYEKYMERKSFKPRGCQRWGIINKEGKETGDLGWFIDSEEAYILKYCNAHQIEIAPEERIGIVEEEKNNEPERIYKKGRRL